MAQTPARDWFLKEWLAYFGKRQSSLDNELGWDKAKADFVWHGKTPYRRDLINAICDWLQIEPFEILMPPERAMSMRRLRETARLIVAEDGAPFAQDDVGNSNTTTIPDSSSPRKAK